MKMREKSSCFAFPTKGMRDTLGCGGRTSFEELTHWIRLVAENLLLGRFGKGPGQCEGEHLLALIIAKTLDLAD